MSLNTKISIFWFRRDLRLEDNTALFHALKSGLPVLPVFIFDSEIISDLSADDSRITFIYDNLKSIDIILKKTGSSLYCLKGKPVEVWQTLITEFNIAQVYFNKDYEPYAINRDAGISKFLNENNIRVHSFKDQVIFEENEILKNDNKPYTIFTPYKNKWLSLFNISKIQIHETSDFSSFMKINKKLPSLESLDFKRSVIKVSDFNLNNLVDYDKYRNIPSIDGTSNLSPHLRFGTVSIRQIVRTISGNPVFLSELIWREFFMQILFHFPNVVHRNFKNKYDNIEWRNEGTEFEKWCAGETGYPLIDAGMRQLHETGLMHNRVRMITAGFLCKHLLIDWKLGEAFFAKKLLDYELSSNNGNWQWSAGTGCDSAPYFRIFNPEEQIKKFDKDFIYIKKFVPDFGTKYYPQKIVEHKFARERALETYKKGLISYK